MEISLYSIKILTHANGLELLNGRFSVDNTTNLITAFYLDDNLQENILSPVNTDYPDWTPVNNTFQNSTPYQFSSIIITKFPHFSYSSYTPSSHYNLVSNSKVYLSSEYMGEGEVTSPMWRPVVMKFTLISEPSCFNEGTKILCLNKNLEEEYIPIENLRKGDLVKSYKHGYRKIDLIGKNNMVNNPNLWHSCMYKMEKTKENGLLEDLIVTGGHAILVNNLGKYKAYNTKLLDSTLMIDDKFLLLSAVSKEFIKLDNKIVYTYYHFTLENNGDDDKRFGVWANGILTETPSKNQFKEHNYTIIN